MPNADKIQWPQGQPQFETHWRAITEALAGNGVVGNGDLQVTATANAMEIQVATGTAWYNGASYSLGTAATFTLSAADATYDRWDTVYFDTSTASAGVRAGTAGSNPEPPDISGSEILLATVYVPAGASDVSGSNILNWRTHSNDADNSYVKDANANFDSATVEGALVEAKNETGGSLTDTLSLPTNPGAFGAVFDAVIDSNSTAGTVHSYFLALDGTNFAEIKTESDGAGGIQNSEIRLHQPTRVNSDVTTGGTSPVTIWDSTNGWVPNEQVQALRNFTADEAFSGYPLAIGTDVNNHLSGGDLLTASAGASVFDSTAGHVPRPQVDDQRTTTTVTTSTYTTADEETVLVDTATIAASSTITLASADNVAGNVIAIGDISGSGGTYPITVDTGGTGETIDGNSSVTLGTSYEARVFLSNGSNWKTLGASFAGLGVEDSGTAVLNAAAGVNFGSFLNVTDDGDNTVTVDADIAGKTNLATGTFTHTGASSTSTTIAAVTTDQTANLHVELGVSSDPAFNAAYAFDYTWDYSWDDTNQEMDVTITATWSTDPGSGNDVVLDYEIYTIDDTATQGVGVEDNGTVVQSPSRSVNFGTGLAVTDDGDQTVTVAGHTPTTIPIVKLTSSSGATDINASRLLPLDNAPLIDTGYYSYTSGNDYVTVDNAGTYEVHVNIGQDPASSSRTSPNADLYKNRTASGTGGTRLSAAGKSGYARRNEGHRESSLHVSWIGSLAAGDTLSIQMSQEASSGTVNIAETQTNMFVKKIPRP